jgi:hypothetical protein
MMHATQATLERFTFMTRRLISQNLINDFAVEPTIETYVMHEMNALAVQVRQDLLNQHLERATVTYPETWVDACKQAFYAWLGTGETGHWPWFGEYASNRWPVTMHVTTVDVKALYPKIALPDREHVVTVWRNDVTKLVR